MILRIVAAILSLLAVAMVVWSMARLANADAEAVAEDERLQAGGVELTAELEYLESSSQKYGKQIQRMRATYEYEGVEHRLDFTCRGCRGTDTVPIWVDPDDPDRFVMEYDSSANQDNTAARLPNFSLAFIGGVIAFVLVVRRRWWLSRPEVS